MKDITSEAFETVKRGLNDLMLHRSFYTYKDLSDAGGINYNTLKSWMNNTKSPRLITLDIMCTNLNIATVELFITIPDFTIKENIDNNSRDKVRLNISKLMLERTRLSLNDCVALFEGEISRDEYISYTRRQNGRVVPLYKLGIIAYFLNVQIWELLK